MASQTYNVGIIGYGMSAKIFHIPLLSVIPTFTLYAIVQRTPNPDDDAEKDHPGIKSYRSTEEMVQDPNVDVVVVTTIPETHFSLTKLALENGKHGSCYTQSTFGRRTGRLIWGNEKSWWKSPSRPPPTKPTS